MRDSLVLRSSFLQARTGFGSIDRLARRILFSVSERLEYGRLTVIDDGGRHVFGRTTRSAPFDVTLRVNDHAFYGYTLTRGSVGLAEAYMLGLVECDDLVGLVRLWVRNEHVMDALDFGWGRLTQPFYRAYHAMRRNTLSGSRHNIQSHYDLGNSFYELFLDPTMTYSAGIYETPESTLEEASREKIARICRKLDLQPDDHLLEIGSGWGALAIHAAKEHGCRVTTVTLSEEQADWARQAIERAGVADRVDLRLQDYREVTGRFDKLVSVEMVEAVGHHYLDGFFARCSDLLRPDGQMLLQSITIRDQRYQAARNGVDFIKRYIFPGSHIPSVSVLTDSIARASTLRLVGLDDITAHYARTLADWRARFLANIDAVRALGYGESFVRMWDLYLAYCEAGFAERFIGDVQLLLHNPQCRQAPALGSLGQRAARPDLDG